MKILREFVYYGTVPDEKLFSILMKIGGPDKVIRHWLRFIKEDHTKIHRYIDA